MAKFIPLSPIMKAAWVLALAIGVVDAIWMGVAGISLALGPLVIRLGFVAILIGLKLFYDWRDMPTLAALLHVAAYSIFFSLVGVILGYLSVSLWFRLYDDLFIRLDQLLGLNWLIYMRKVVSISHLFHFYNFIYFTIVPQIFIMTAILCRLNRIDRAEGLAFDLAFTGVACIFISTLVPALGTYVSLDPDHIQLAIHLEHVQAIRAGSFKIIDLNDIAGLITFPSYHAVISLTLIWASRGIPWLYHITLILNTTVILATPIIGGHYFVDLVGGALVWVGVLLFRSWVIPVTALNPLSRRPAGGWRTEGGQEVGMADISCYEPLAHFDADVPVRSVTTST